MTRSLSVFASLTFVAIFWASETRAQEAAGALPSRPLFNGRNLDGWVPVNTAPSTWRVENEMLVCTGKPIGEIRTEKMYQNFILELEWRHLKPAGNAGVFVWADDITARGVPFHRGIEVQVLENAYGNNDGHTTHGDIFPIHGAKMTPVNGRGGSRAFPTEFRANPSPEWNHYRIECREGNISLAVNGKVVTRGEACSPRKGYICLESEGGVVNYRNIALTELPETPVDAEHIAIANRDFRSLYNGIDLSGWHVDGDWSSADWRLKFNGNSIGRITTTQDFSDIGFVVDFLLADRQAAASIILRGVSIDVGGKSPYESNIIDGWNRIEGVLQGNRLSFSINGSDVETAKAVKPADAGPLELVASGKMDFANIFVRQVNP